MYVCVFGFLTDCFCRAFARRVRTLTRPTSRDMFSNCTNMLSISSLARLAPAGFASHSAIRRSASAILRGSPETRQFLMASFTSLVMRPDFSSTAASRSSCASLEGRNCEGGRGKGGAQYVSLPGTRASDTGCSTHTHLCLVDGFHPFLLGSLAACNQHKVFGCGVDLKGPATLGTQLRNVALLVASSRFVVCLCVSLARYK